MTAIVPGSYSPITLGHVDIIERAAKMFDRVIVAVMNNDSAEHDSTLSSKTYDFTAEERLHMAKIATEHIDNVEVIASGGLLVDLFERTGADTVVRGIRNAADLEYEMKHYSWNFAHNPRFEVAYLPASEKYEGISSSVIRELLGNKANREALKKMLPASVLDYLYDNKQYLQKGQKSCQKRM